MPHKTIGENLKLTLPNTKSRIQRERVKLSERFLAYCVVSSNETGDMVSFEIEPACIALKNEPIQIENEI